ncbi:hypothetical protein QQS21_004969 [Conoideocrella luteorostrata]|uniref:Uncharacterized protein n=1 Tax=Conoideocrella luteorostrata TaxID=1105319 RepID=A0AAJ0FU87_9HYPO|nr:hypothetical protein QQS21_004969 [Conoideocrella luteorostrata]
MGKNKFKSASTVPAQIANIGQVVNYLQSYSPDEPLDTVSHDFLRAILRKLRNILERSSSELNCDKIQAIEECCVDNKVSEHFECWRNDPSEFWELSLAILPKNSGLHGTKEKLRIFFHGALKLDIQLKIRRIHWRFLTISAHAYFRRQYPTGKITDKKVRHFLQELCLSASDNEVSRCMSILTGGQRRTEFCRSLQVAGQNAMEKIKGCAGTNESANHDPAKKQETIDYGPMFLDTIPDDIWDKKNGLYGYQAKASIAHLLSIKIQQWSAESGCEALATKLLAFHERFIWNDSTINGEKRHGESIVCKEPKRQRLIAMSYNTSNSQAPESVSVRQDINIADTEKQQTPYTAWRPGSPWDYLLSAASSAEQQKSRTDGTGLPQVPGLSTWNAKRAHTAAEHPGIHSRVASRRTSMEESPLIIPSRSEGLWNDVSESAAPLHELNAAVKLPAIPYEHAGAAQPLISTSTDSSGFTINTAAESLPGELLPGCGQSPLSTMPISNYLETFWPNTVPGSVEDLLQNNTSSLFLPVQQLNSNDLEILWNFAGHCGTDDATVDL